MYDNQNNYLVVGVYFLATSKTTYFQGFEAIRYTNQNINTPQIMLYYLWLVLKKGIF